MKITTQIVKIMNNDIIYVTISDADSNTKEDFDNFSQNWRRFYLEKKNFIFRIDTTHLRKPNITYCYKIAMLIREFKNNDIQYLKYSIIVIPNPYIRCLLNFIMNIQKPIATIYVTKNVKDANTIHEYKLDNSPFLEAFILLNNISVIES